MGIIYSILYIIYKSMLLLTVGHSNVGNTAKSFDYLFCEHGLSCQGLLLLKKIAVPLFFNVLSNTTVHFR